MVIALVAAGLAAAAVIGAPAESAGSYRVDAIFDTAKGIIPGQLVKVAGARVGSIEDVQLTKDYKARIVMSVPRRFEFRNDASCNIQPEGLISENFVQCDPGTPGKETLGGDPAPTVPVDRTSVPVSITDLFRVFQADVRQRFTVALMAIGGGLASRGADLNNIILRSSPTLAAVRKLMGDLAAQKDNLSSAVRDTDRAIAELAARKGRVADFIEQAERVSAQAADRRGDIAETIRRLPPLLDASDRAIGHLNRLLANGQPLLGELREAAPGLNRVVGQIGPFARAARPGDPAARRRGGHGPAHRPQRRARSCGCVRTFTTQTGPVGKALADTLTNLRDRGGVEYMLRFIYFSAAATSRFDSTSHILPAHAVDGGQCTFLATEPVEGCNAFFRDNPATRSDGQAAQGPRPRPRRDDAAGRAHRDAGPQYAGQRRPRRRATAGPQLPADPQAARGRHEEASGRPRQGRRRPHRLPPRPMSSRTGNPAHSGTPLTNPVLVGTTIVVALLVGVFLSYNANKGLPFVTTFPLNAKVPDAQQLVKNSEVRIGGFRVGQVVDIVAQPAEGKTPPVRAAEDEARRRRQQDPGRHARAGAATLAAGREVRRADPGRHRRGHQGQRHAAAAQRPHLARARRDLQHLRQADARGPQGRDPRLRGLGRRARTGHQSLARRRQRADGPARACRQAARVRPHRPRRLHRGRRAVLRRAGPGGRRAGRPLRQGGHHAPGDRRRRPRLRRGLRRAAPHRGDRR